MKIVFPEDNKCNICNRYITVADVNNNNYVYCETKRKTKNFVHKTCLERRKNKYGTRD